MKDAWPLPLATLLITLLVLTTSAFVVSCSSSTDDDDEVTVTGAISATMPDNRILIVDASGELRILDANSPTNVTDAIELLIDPIDPGGVLAGGVALDPYDDRLWISHPNTSTIPDRVA